MTKNLTPVRRGRAPTYGSGVKHFGLTLTDDHYAVLYALGRCNASRGLRDLVEDYIRRTGAPWPPSEVALTRIVEHANKVHLEQVERMRPPTRRELQAARIAERRGAFVAREIARRRALGLDDLTPQLSNIAATVPDDLLQRLLDGEFGTTAPKIRGTGAPAPRADDGEAPPAAAPSPVEVLRKTIERIRLRALEAEDEDYVDENTGPESEDRP